MKSTPIIEMCKSLKITAAGLNIWTGFATEGCWANRLESLHTVQSSYIGGADSFDSSCTKWKP